MNTVVRAITSEHISEIATVHAASWRSAYRGVLRDEFLQSDLVANRTGLWSRRLLNKPQRHFGFISLVDDKVVGFAFAFGDEDEKWGTQLDNLHVLPEYKGQGLGKKLLSAIARTCVEQCELPALHLWVYEANTQGQAFYASFGAQRGERLVIQAPGGGEVAELRYVWPSAQALAQCLPPHDA
jgi:ribosomal protein S18 acetylase RimI-like enzyme